MKFNTLRHLIAPWFLLFLAIIAAMVVEGTLFQLDKGLHEYYFGVLGLGIFFCLMSNFQTLTKAGIWLAHSLPRTVKRQPMKLFMRAVIAAAIAGAVFKAGEISWIPLIWQGAVIPAVFTVCLFVAVWNLMAPILSFCSQIAFSRLSSFVLSWPVFLLVPITALFLGRTIVNAYKESRPDFVAAAQVTVIEEDPESTADQKIADEELPPVTPEAQELQTAALSGKNCDEQKKIITNSLTADTPDDQAYWATRAVKCTDIKSVIGLPRLVDVMLKHKNHRVRASAIQAMSRYSREDVKRIGYLLVKRVSDEEPLPVIEAASLMLLRLGEDETGWVSRRLTSLLDVTRTSALASKLLVNKLKKEELVSEYVSTHLLSQGEQKDRAISMICSLPEKTRSVADPSLERIVAEVKTGDESDPALAALECMGHKGLETLRKEIAKPEHLEKPVAARALAEADWSQKEEVLKTASECVKDSSDEVRTWCSQALGKMGVPAVPRILELLKSSDPELKSAGTNALRLFKDPLAREKLIQVRAENSGWMATQEKLAIARAVDQALTNMK